MYLKKKRKNFTCFFISTLEKDTLEKKERKEKEFMYRRKKKKEFDLLL
jgi:hypothetical protein